MHLSVSGRELAGAGYGDGGKLYSGAACSVASATLSCVAAAASAAELEFASLGAGRHTTRGVGRLIST